MVVSEYRDEILYVLIRYQLRNLSWRQKVMPVAEVVNCTLTSSRSHHRGRNPPLP
jgi:hypothetical protein